MFDRPFTLYTDASAEAFAAVLSQVWERKDYVPTDTSRKALRNGMQSGMEMSKENINEKLEKQTEVESKGEEHWKALNTLVT